MNKTEAMGYECVFVINENLTLPSIKTEKAITQKANNENYQIIKWVRLWIRVIETVRNSTRYDLGIWSWRGGGGLLEADQPSAPRIYTHCVEFCGCPNRKMKFLFNTNMKIPRWTDQNTSISELPQHVIELFWQTEVSSH